MIQFDNKEHFLTYGYDKLLEAEAALFFERSKEAMIYSHELGDVFYIISRKLQSASDAYKLLVLSSRHTDKK